MILSPRLGRALAMAIVPFLCGLWFAHARADATTEEEFVGPFPSWLDVRRDFGAVGDGNADDTAAIQRALNAIRTHEKSCVLYFPAGTYRVTKTLTTRRINHTDNMVTLVGEAPEKVILLWDGPEGGTMLEWDAWYAKISRMTFDGRKRAGTCLFYGSSFSTYNETSDIVFLDAENGLVFGSPQTAGQAENEVLRCRFLRCDVGIQTVNWNSMDIWVWYCHFEDCGRGIHNVMGNWHAWHNVFLRSRIADVSIANLMVFSVVNNVSLNSHCFLDFSSGHTWGSPTSITGNRIIDPVGPWAMLLDNAGPYLVMDNEFRLGPESRAVRMTWGDQTLVANRYTRPDAVLERGRFRRLGERIVDAAEISEDLPRLPDSPQKCHRPIIDVPSGADARTIQAAIDKAIELREQRPVVHLPMGSYRIDQTLVVPPGADLQLVGDGASEVATRLVWDGPPGGCVLKIQGPSSVHLRDIHINATSGRAISLEIPDAENSYVLADQLNVTGPNKAADGIPAAICVKQLKKATVQFRALQGSGQAGRWVRVIGPGDEMGAPVGVFTGATGSAVGQYEVQRNGYLVVRSIYHERSSDSVCGLYLGDSGILSIDATRFSYATDQDSPTVLLESFRGMCTLATCLLMPVGTEEACRLEVRGDGSQTSFLLLNNQFWVTKPGTTADTVWKNSASPPARGGFFGCNLNTSNKDVSPRGFEFLPEVPDSPDPARSRFGSAPFDNRGSADEELVVRHLEPLRKVRPLSSFPGNAKSAILIKRVIATGHGDPVVEIRCKE